MSLYDSTVDMLSLLSEDDLEAVNTVVKRFVIKEEEPFFKPITKAQVLHQLDVADKQFEAGEYKNSETMENELAEEFGLA